MINAQFVRQNPGDLLTGAFASRGHGVLHSPAEVIIAAGGAHAPLDIIH
jgi:hypothetical protein